MASSQLRVLVEELGCNVNASDTNECTALHLAASLGQLEVVRLLAAHLDADTKARDCAGRSCVHTAAEKGHDK